MGGIALANGLILVSERYWAASIREPGGDIVTASGRKVRVPVGGREEVKAGRRVCAGARASRAGTGVNWGGGVPLLRGLGRFAESLVVLAQVKMRLPAAQLPLQGGRVLAALVASFGAGEVVKAVAPKSALVQEAGGALAAFIPAVLAVKDTSISGYHGAEHKVIGGLEAASAAKDAAKEHDRCGSNLIGPYLLATVATNLLARGRKGAKSPAASALAGAASLGIALEALRWATTHGDTVLGRLLLMPGRAVQRRLTTSEPTPEQLEVGQAALKELLRLEGAGVGRGQRGPATGGPTRPNLRLVQEDAGDGAVAPGGFGRFLQVWRDVFFVQEIALVVLGVPAEQLRVEVLAQPAADAVVLYLYLHGTLFS
jgi:hypothetical protein